MRGFRICPSPTGTTHLGTARTGLVSYVLAKQQGAKFHLRLEDTDVVRSTDKFADGIVDAFTWLGVEFEPMVIKQSEQETAGIYKQIAHLLIQAGLAYKCGCTPIELKKMKAYQIKTKAKLGYVGICREKAHNDGAIRLNISALREFLDPDKETHGGLKDLRYHDSVFGDRHTDIRDLNDIVLVRASGTATYLFANTIDDLLMGVTDIVRGADLLPQTSIQILLRLVIANLKGLSEETPKYTHVPLVLGENKEKLSKRSPTTISITGYKNKGILPEAVVQFALSIGNKSITIHKPLSMKDIIETYDETKNSRVNVGFSEHQLLYVNKQHIRSKTAEELNNLMGTDFNPLLVELFKGRVNTLVVLKAEIEEAISIKDTLKDSLHKLIAKKVNAKLYQEFRDKYLEGKSTISLDLLAKI